jgi:ABC-type multidrug transport system fused ATPase/permease subunit
VLARGAVFAVAWAAAEGDAAALAAGSVALAALYVVVSVGRATVVRRATVTFVDASLRALLGSDVLAVSQRPGGGTLTAVLDGLYFAPRLVADVLPALAADALAAVPLTLLLAAETPPRVVGLGVIALAVAAPLVLIGRSWAARLAEASRNAFEAVYEDLVAAVGARLELLASGHEEEFLVGSRDRVKSWERVSMRSDALTWLAGRAPVVAAVLVVVLAILGDAALRGAVAGRAWWNAVLFASVAPAWLGLARGAFELVRSTGRLRAYDEVLGAARPQRPLPAPASPRLPPSRVAWRGVSFGYHSGGDAPAALRDVSVEWLRGETLLVRGPNGSGKTTLLRLLLGLGQPDAGTVVVDDVDLRSIDLPAWRRGIAYLPQRPYFGETATVRQTVRLIVPDADDARITSSLERLGLAERLASRAPGGALDAPVAALSAGERQRLALARVLCADAPVLLLDEPDANLDEGGVGLLCTLLRELAPERMIAFAAHSQELARVADVVVELEGGRVVRCEPSRPRRSVTAR